ncbi:MAG TPA: NUDIX domain-containing protein [Lachnospiraceae bacterium]|nr:NUDIX domain-containing protein [Lachnospiraceae bacterium]
MNHEKNTINEQLFLDNYDPKAFAPMAVTVDVVVFGIKKRTSGNYRKLDIQDLNILLIKRDDYPYKDYYSLPGGFVKQDETIDQAATRVLKGKTGLNNIYCEQLYTFGDVDRDPRMRIISCAYIALIDANTAKINDAEWFSIDEIPSLQLAFDHNNITCEALKRLRGKINYTDIVFHMMPKRFTISELQEVYEIILGEKLIPAAFRRFISDKIQETDELTKNAGHRPSRIYEYIRR